MNLLYCLLFGSVFPFLALISPSKHSILNNEIEKGEFLSNYYNFQENYRKLDAKQKLQMWKYRIKNASELTILNHKQKLICDEACEQLNLELFQKPHNYYLEEMQKLLESALGKEKANMIFTSFAKNWIEHNWLKTENSPTTKCHCSTKSDFCPGKTACTQSDCEKSKVGCGLLWLYDCNGLCK